MKQLYSPIKVLVCEVTFKSGYSEGSISYDGTVISHPIKEVEEIFHLPVSSQPICSDDCIGEWFWDKNISDEEIIKDINEEGFELLGSFIQCFNESVLFETDFCDYKVKSFSIQNSVNIGNEKFQENVKIQEMVIDNENKIIVQLDFKKLTFKELNMIGMKQVFSLEI